mgnify:CR=1 FL=1
MLSLSDCDTCLGIGKTSNRRTTRYCDCLFGHVAEEIDDGASKDGAFRVVGWRLLLSLMHASGSRRLDSALLRDAMKGAFSV